ncbi:hypothetical protein ACFV23_26970, partial [Streptomyces sp. NPDC059627]
MSEIDRIGTGPPDGRHPLPVVGENPHVDDAGEGPAGTEHRYGEEEREREERTRREAAARRGVRGAGLTE